MMEVRMSLVQVRCGYLLAGHDAWVIGSEPAVVVDIAAMATCAKPGLAPSVRR
jgi:hypothetical protein